MDITPVRDGFVALQERIVAGLEASTVARSSAMNGRVPKAAEASRA